MVNRDVTSISLSYFICATPRSGSNFLCEVLRTTGVAGQPDDYFWNPPYWYAQWGVAGFPGFVRRLLCEATTANGVLGSKLMWDQLGDLVAGLAALHGLAETRPPEVLAAAFPNVHYVWLTRRDKVRQGISYYRAMETKIWRSGDALDGARADPQFNYEAIDRMVQLSTWEDDAWRDFFRRYAIEPHVVTYEDLAATPTDVAQRVQRYLGISPTLEVRDRIWQHQQQADALSEEWVERYHARTLCER